MPVKATSDLFYERYILWAWTAIQRAFSSDLNVHWGLQSMNAIAHWISVHYLCLFLAHHSEIRLNFCWWICWIARYNACRGLGCKMITVSFCRHHAALAALTSSLLEPSYAFKPSPISLSSAVPYVPQASSWWVLPLHRVNWSVMLEHRSIHTSTPCIAFAQYAQLSCHEHLCEPHIWHNLCNLLWNFWPIRDDLQDQLCPTSLQLLWALCDSHEISKGEDCKTCCKSTSILQGLWAGVCCYGNQSVWWKSCQLAPATWSLSI